YFFFLPFFADGLRGGGALAPGNSPFSMVNMNGSGVYLVITPMMSVVAPGAGGFTNGFSNSTWISALFAALFSSVRAASRLSLVAAMTFTSGIFKRASPFFCIVWIDCQTLSAASLLAGEQFALERMNSLSLKPSEFGSFCCTACTANSHGVGAGLM